MLKSMGENPHSEAFESEQAPTQEEVKEDIFAGIEQNLKALDDLMHTENYREFGMTAVGAAMMGFSLLELHHTGPEFVGNMMYLLGCLSALSGVQAGSEKLAQQFRFLKERIKTFWG